VKANTDGLGGDDVGWITPVNLAKVKSALGKASGLEEASVSVGCVTTDFAMQNVLLQMGLNVVSVDGTVRVFRQKFTLEDSIGSHASEHACDQWHSSRESTALTVVIINHVQTLKAC
jgi:hypothetical protein